MLTPVFQTCFCALNLDLSAQGPRQKFGCGRMFTGLNLKEAAPSSTWLYTRLCTSSLLPAFTRFFHPWFFGLPRGPALTAAQSPPLQHPLDGPGGRNERTSEKVEHVVYAAFMESCFVARTSRKDHATSMFPKSNKGFLVDKLVSKASCASHVALQSCLSSLSPVSLDCLGSTPGN